MKNDWTFLVGGVGLGAGLTYLLDPERGPRRRAYLRDQAVHAAHAVADCMDTTARDLRNRATGVAAEVRGRFENGGVTDDETLTARVRSAMGRVVSHPHAIQVLANSGRITLSGPVLAREEKRLLSTVSGVRGVTGVDNRLELHESPGDLPALQGDSRVPGMRRNWPPATRLLAGAAGGGLAVYGAARRDAPGALLGIVGLGLLARGASNLPVDRLTGIGAGHRAVDIQKTLNIDATVDEVYAFCISYENWPRFMSHVREIKTDGGARSHWVVDGPAGVPVSWDAVITQFVPNSLLAWQSVEGSMIRQDGIMRFSPNAEGGTRLDIRISYNPPAGAVGHAVATLFGANPERLMDEDFNRLKSLIEEGKTSARGTGEVTREDLAA